MLALLIGGSSVPGLPSTLIVQVVVLALLPLLVDWQRPASYWAPVSWLPIAALVLIAFQLLPVGALLHGPAGTVGGIALPAALALTMDWSRTADILVSVVPAALLFVVLSRFSENDFNRLLPFLYLGLLFNIVLGLVQFAARSDVSPGFLPYAAAAGFFANQNHFATLMFVGIPLVIYQFVAIRRPLLSLVAVAIIVIASFATRSVAGAILSVGAALVSYAVVARIGVLSRIGLLAVAVIGAVVLAFNPGNVLEFRPDDPLDRLTIWSTTTRAIAAYLPLGSGFGTFDIVYPQFEAAADVRAVFINHAHNEYLELLLEGGVAAGLLVLAYLALLVAAMARLPQRPLRWAAFCGLLFMLAHSLADYPLRTPALLLVFVVLNAIVFHRGLEQMSTDNMTRSTGEKRISTRTIRSLASSK